MLPFPLAVDFNAPLSTFFLNSSVYSLRNFSIMRVYCLLCFVLFHVCTIYGQDASHSRQKRIHQLKTATVSEKSAIYDELAQSYFGTRNDSVLYFAEKNIALGEKYNSKRALTLGLMHKGITYSKIGFPEEGIDYMTEAIRLRMELGDLELIARGHLDIGNAYQQIGTNDEDAGEEERAEKHFKLAHLSYKKANQIALQLQDSLVIAKSYKNLASANYALYEYHRAIAIYDTAYQWVPSKKKDYYKGEIDMNIASCQVELGHNDSAIAHYASALPLLQKYQRYEEWASANLTMAYVYSDSDIDRAIALYEEADSVAKIAGSKPYQARANLSLYELFNQKKDYEKALAYYRTYNKLQLQVSNVEYDSKVGVLQQRFDNERTKKKLLEQRRKKEQEIARSQLLKTGILSLCGVVLVLIVLFLQRIRINRLHRKRLRDAHNQEINALIKDQELETIEAALTGQETERKRIAEDLHDRLGSSLSAVRMYFEAATDRERIDSYQLKKAYQLLDTSIEDMRGIAHNLITGTLSKFGLFAALEDLKNTIEGTGNVAVTYDFQVTEERFHKEIEINVYRIIQEAFSNALKHASPTLLFVQFSQQEDEVLIRIQDNGSGFDAYRDYNGMGLKNIKARVQKLGGDLFLESHINRGTHYEIQLKLSQNEETDYS